MWLTDNTYKYEDLVRMMGEIISALEGKIRVSAHWRFPFTSELNSWEGQEEPGAPARCELSCSKRSAWTQRAEAGAASGYRDPGAHVNVGEAAALLSVWVSFLRARTTCLLPVPSRSPLWWITRMFC